MISKQTSVIRRRSTRDRDQGIALIAVMMILALVSTLALSSMETTMRDNQVAAVQMRNRVAFQAAEAGLAVSLASMTNNAAPTLLNSNIGIVGDYPMGQPSFQLNPTVATPIENLGAQPAPGMSLNINGNGPKFQLQLWRIHVEGSEPRGMTSRIEAATAALWGK
jgi:type II secretory pathway pseudopilin PulG